MRDYFYSMLVSGFLTIGMVYSIKSAWLDYPGWISNLIVIIVSSFIFIVNWVSLMDMLEYMRRHNEL